MAQGQDQKPERRVLYIGDDDGYWQTIKKRIQNNQQSEFDYQQIRKGEYKSYHLLFLDILHDPPSFIYLDFSDRQQFRLKLANLLKRENSLKQMPIVGLVDEKEMIEDCIFAGVDLIHVKCGEYHDVVHDPLYLAFPKDTQEPDFARAQFERDANIISDFRIGYITPQYLHAEGNMELSEGDIIDLETNIPRSLIPSKRYRVKKVDDKNIYYDYNYSYDLEFLFVDEPESAEAEIEEAMQIEDENRRNLVVKKKKEDYQYKLAEYKGRLEQAKKQTHKWIVDHIEDSKPKKTKILLVDKTLDFLKTLDRDLDEFPFTIRTQTYLTENFDEVHHTRPDIIALQLYDEKEVKEKVEQDFNTFTHKDGTPLSEQEIQEAKNEELKKAQEKIEGESLDLLSAMVKKIKSFEQYKPFLIVFNCGTYNSHTIQDSFKYPFIIAHNAPLKLKTVTDMAIMFEKRNDKKFEDHINAKIAKMKEQDPTKYRNLTRQSFIEKRYFVSKSNPLSRASYYYPIVLQTLTESDCTFYCDKKLVMDTYRIDLPVSMSVTLIPFEKNKVAEKSGDGYIYQGLIHSVGENDKKKLRQFVNEIFFSPLNEEREKEHQAFLELNEQERKKRSPEEGEESGEEGEEDQESSDSDKERPAVDDSEEGEKKMSSKDSSIDQFSNKVKKD